jgi:hypothetical protein
MQHVESAVQQQQQHTNICFWWESSAPPHILLPFILFVPLFLPYLLFSLYFAMPS